jgi:Replication-relaxation
MAELVLQERDTGILRGLLDSRLATLRHISLLYFEGKAEYAKKRMQKLKAAGYISEKRSRRYEPAILFLTDKGFQTLRKQGLLSNYPEEALSGFKRRMTISEMTLKHELAVLDVKAAMQAAIEKQTHLRVGEFSTWPLLHQFQLGHKGQLSYALVKPDGFLRIREEHSDGTESDYTFFLEVDRGSETLSTLANKAVWYNRFYKEGGMAVRRGHDPSAYRDFPFRALFIVQSPERQMNLAKALLATTPPILTQACITTFDEVFSNPLGNIWIQPMALKQATASAITQEMKRPLLE